MDSVQRDCPTDVVDRQVIVSGDTPLPPAGAARSLKSACPAMSGVRLFGDTGLEIFNRHSAESWGRGAILASSGLRGNEVAREVALRLARDTENMQRVTRRPLARLGARSPVAGQT